ncbi:hypothetical protein BC830DRAFT_1164425 [Chytriomyces sp. MP71]|nr:hypothetical protein BC830DRAFT_1164425 [Chytriomyces sp. MP71]
MSWLWSDASEPATVERLPDPSAAEMEFSDNSMTFYVTTDSGRYALVQPVRSGSRGSPQSLHPKLCLTCSAKQTNHLATCRIDVTNNSKFAQTLAPATESSLVSADNFSATCAPLSITHNPATRSYAVHARLGVNNAVDATFTPRARREHT